MPSTLNEFLENALSEVSKKDLEKIQAPFSGVNPIVIKGYFSDLDISDAKIDRVVDFVKIYDKKLAKKIDGFFIDYYRKKDIFEREILQLMKKRS